jgi:aspartyl protease family protein
VDLQAMKNFILFALFALAAGALVPGFIDKTGGTPAPSAKAAKPEPTPAASSPQYGRTMTVRRDKRGHFQVQARVDGRHMDFLVDTGASVVAIPEKEAARLGVRPTRRDYTVQMKTANGTVMGALAHLRMVEVGGITVRDVQAVVMPDEALSENLLGMSFLSKLRRFEMADGKLVLEQ